MARFKRILLKLSGESLMGKQGYGIDPERLSDYARQIKEVSEMGVQIGIVIGGGNIFRGLSGSQKGFVLVSSIPNGKPSRRWNKAISVFSQQERVILISPQIQDPPCVVLKSRQMSC